ncbi:hypothetical protein GJAV_G00028610 [Gymnothorax javanicus]|nr:hypothetical protein GJAV_G00028610 [Gymnothorax javanicus]
MLSCTADRGKLPPYIVFKKKTLPKEKFPAGIIVRAQHWTRVSSMIGSDGTEDDVLWADGEVEEPAGEEDDDYEDDLMYSDSDSELRAVCEGKNPFLDSTPFPQSTDYKKKEWEGSYESSAVEKAHDFELCVTLDNECTPSPVLSTEMDQDTAVLSQLGRKYLEDTKRSTFTNDRGQERPMDDITHQTVQPCTIMKNKDQQKLLEENMWLRNRLMELLKKSESDNQKIQDLKEHLHKQKEKEQSEAQALETMVQSVEQNLQKMTKRAVKAETSASKLKQELLLLQDQLEVYRTENEKLRAAETTTVCTMKQNAQIASEYISKAANNAQTSIRQLLSEAETLGLVSQMLCSIDKISQMQPEDW